MRRRRSQRASIAQPSPRTTACPPPVSAAPVVSDRHRMSRRACRLRVRCRTSGAASPTDSRRTPPDSPPRNARARGIRSAAPLASRSASPGPARRRGPRPARVRADAGPASYHARRAPLARAYAGRRGAPRRCPVWSGVRRDLRGRCPRNGRRFPDNALSSARQGTRSSSCACNLQAPISAWQLPLGAIGSARIPFEDQAAPGGRRQEDPMNSAHRKSLNVVAALGVSIAASTALPGTAWAQNSRGTIANNDAVFIDSQTFEIRDGKAKGDVAAQIRNLGALELGGGAIIFRSGGKLYI